MYFELRSSRVKLFILFSFSVFVSLHSIATNCAAQSIEKLTLVVKDAQHGTPHLNLSQQGRNKVSKLISRRHYMRPTYDQVFALSRDYKSIERYLKSLDRYSRYLTPDHVEFLETREGDFRIDIGLDFLITEEELLVIPSPGGSAESAGFQLPAYLITINGKPLEYAKFESYRFLSALKPGEQLRVVTQRPDEKLEREYLIMTKPRYRQLVMDSVLGNIGIIRIDRFKHGWGEKIANSLNNFSQKKQIVIDLRYNPGGDLYAAVDNISLLIPKGHVVAYIRKQKDGSMMPLKSLSGLLLKNEQQIYILVSKYTASSAEIFAEALKIHRPNSIVVGEKTRGKCMALERLKLQDGAALELITHEVIGADGLACEGSPLVPDIFLSNIVFKSVTDIVKDILIE